MAVTKKKLPKKISKFVKDKYYSDKPVVKTGKATFAYYYENGLLTIEEYEKLNKKQLDLFHQKFIVNNVIRDTDLMAFYIYEGKSSKWYKKRPTPRVLGLWKAEKDAKLRERDKTWWQPLTDAQKHFVVVNTPKGKPYVYMGKPLSKHNITSIKSYIVNSTGIASLLPKKNIKVIDKIEPIEILKRQREQLGEQVKKLFGREQQVLNTLRINFPAFNTEVSNDSKVPSNVKTANTVAREHGLNEYKRRNKIKSNTEIAPVYLKQLKNKKIDYYVNSYQNAVALAEAVGMLPQELFQTLCYQIKKRQTYFKKQEFLNTGNAVAELVETYQTKSKRMMKQGDIKLSMRAFYRSLERKEWSKKYNWDWKNHARFNEEFNDWLKIMTAEAKPKK
jgi:hypothetical protein